MPRAPRQPLPPGRHGLSPSFVASDQRARMLAVCAELVIEKGYVATTIDDVVRASRVSRKTFYEHFTSKEDAFLTALDAATALGLERVRAAFASTDDWPEQVRRGLRALLELVAAEPAFSLMAYVESPLVGREGRARYDASAAEFEFFLAPGFALAAHAVPREVGRMVGAGIQELISTCVRQGTLDDIPGLLPAATYLCLVPFLGPTAAAQEAGLEA
jgi:AcrR family transcriptional regulator